MLKIYLTDLAAYNNGFLIGEWISLPMEQEDLENKLEAILEQGQTACKSIYPHEEYFITDYEWEEVSLFSIEEYHNLTQLNQQLSLLEDFKKYQLKTISFLFDENLIIDLEEAIEKMDDVIIHEDSTMEDIAYDYIEQCFDIESMPSLITTNIDYKGIGEDMKIDGSYYEIDGDIYEYIG